MDSPAIGQGGSEPLAGNVRVWCYPAQPECLVECSGVVRKKDGGLQFCIEFHHLNAHMKKDSYPLPRIQEVLESLVGAGHFPA